MTPDSGTTEGKWRKSGEPWETSIAPRRVETPVNKKVVFGVIAGLIAVILIWVVTVVVGVTDEASHMDTALRDDIRNHVQQDVVKKQLTTAGYTYEETPGEVKATGPRHSLAGLYTAWLTIDITFDAQGAINSYHLDRAK